MKTCILFLVMTVTAFCGGCSRPILQSTIDSAWNPSVLSKDACPNIEGKYWDKGMLKRQFDFRLLSMLHDPESLGELPVAYTSFREITPDGLTSKDFFARRKAFDDQAVTSIQQRGRIIEVVLMDGGGIEYSKATLKLDHPQVGCYNGALVIRRQYRTSGGEGNPGIITAGEHEFRKLDDGSLQVIKRTREWSRSLAEYPRKTETIQIFPPAP